ncbi:MAG: ABC transporter substrate-binding protein [Burkholderiaceae bacterium]
MKRACCAAALWCCCTSALTQAPLERTPVAAPAPDSASAPRRAISEGLDAAALHGRRLYRTGRNRQGEAISSELAPGVPIEGELAACARCHGVDGTGRREAGLIAPALDWAALTQGRAAGAGMVSRAAYSQASLLRALRDGVASDGERLAAAMPRYQLPARDAADLLAYLQHLGSDADRDPGVAEHAVTLAVILPLSGTRGAAGGAAKNAIAACVERANRAGVPFGRRIELLLLDSASLPATELAARAADETLLAVAPWWGDLDARTLADRLPDLPLIGPLGNAAELEDAPAGVYAVAPQLGDQARLLVDAMARRDPGARADASLPDTGARRIALIAAPLPRYRSAARAAKRQAALYEGVALQVWTATPGADGPHDAAAWLALQPHDGVLVLGSAPWAKAAAEVAARSGSPALQEGSVHVVYAELGRAALDWPADLRATLLLSLGSARDASLNPKALLADLAGIGAASQAPGIESLAYSAACLSVEALKRSGRSLTRAGVRRALETIHDFETGVSPPLSFAPGQRKGVWGAELVRLTPSGSGAFTNVQRWQTPRQP